MRTVQYELEAKLRPIKSKGKGHAEWKVFGNGEKEIKVALFDLQFPSNTMLSIIVDSTEVGEMSVKQNSATYLKQSELGETVPTFFKNQKLQISHAGRVVFEGLLYED